MKSKPERGMSPAALGALLNGDMTNALVAMTPGGIEAQEAAGQQTFVGSEWLPIRGTEGVRDKLEALGFVLGDAVDSLFVEARLPPGWAKKACEHSMWSDLIDAKGRRRAGIFYKAAFYDRSAHIMWASPVWSGALLEDGGSFYDLKEGVPGTCFGIVKHLEIEVFQSQPFAVVGGVYGADRQAYDMAKAYALEHYPLYQTDPFAYWEQT